MKESFFDMDPIVLIVWRLTPFFKSISAVSRDAVHLTMLSGVVLTSTPHNILSKPLSAFPHNTCRNNGKRSTWKEEYMEKDNFLVTRISLFSTCYFLGFI